MSNDNSSSNSDRLSGVSIRVNGVNHGAQVTGPNVVPNGQPVQATVRGTSNAVTTFQAFDEQHVGDLEGVQPFADVYERTAAIRDPRYAKSPAYRNYVRQRLAAGLRQSQGQG